MWLTIIYILSVILAYKMARNLRKEEITKGEAAMYGMIATLPDRGSVKNFVIDFLKDQYKVK